MVKWQAMRRRALVGLSGVGLGLLASACGVGGAAGRTPEGAARQLRPVTLRWSTWGDANNPFNSDAAPKGLELFNQKLPNIKVIVEPQPGGWPTKNTAAWIAGDGPDVTGHCCQYGPTFARQGFLVDLDPFIKRDAKQVPSHDYVEWLIQMFHSPESGQFALPMYSGTMGIYYNKELFKQRGVSIPDDTWDWNAYRDAAIKLTNAEKNQWGRVQGAMLQRLHQNGAHLVDPKDDRKAAFDSPAALAAFQYEHAAAHKDHAALITGGPKAPDAIKGLDSYQQFAAGRYAMWESGSWILTRLVKFVGDAVDWDVAVLPKGPVQRDTLATNDGWSIWKGSKAIDESWELVRFLQGDEWMEIATRIVGQQTARKSYQEKWIKLTKEGSPSLATKTLKAFTDGVTQNYARPTELWRNQTESNKVYSEAYNLAVRDGEAEVVSTMKEAAQRVNELNR